MDNNYFFVQKEAINYASQLLEKYMPGVTIFPAVGNHEGAPVNRCVICDPLRENGH